MVSSRLLDTLSTWVVHESNKVGGMAMLSSLLTNACGERISDAAIAKWRDKKIGQGGLRGKSLNAIAAYRQMSPSEVLAWLETGKDPKGELIDDTDYCEPTPDRLQRLEQTLASVIAEISQIRASLTLNRELSVSLHENTPDGVSFGLENLSSTMPFQSIRELCEYEFQQMGVSFETGVEELLLSFPAESPSEKRYLENLITGTAPLTEQGAYFLSTALEVLTGKEYTAQLIMEHRSPDCANHNNHAHR